MRTRTYGVPCPQDDDHGNLLDWPGARTAFYCPSRAHRSPAFYTTDLVPVTRTGQQDLAGDKAAPRSRDDAARSRSPERMPEASALPAAAPTPLGVAATATETSPTLGL